MDDLDFKTNVEVKIKTNDLGYITEFYLDEAFGQSAITDNSSEILDDLDFDTNVEVKIKTNDLGYITEFYLDKELMQSSIIDYSSEKLESILSHFGVKGMRWGVRKKSGSGSSGNAESTTKTKVKKASDLSDEDLKKVVARLQLEKQYNSLTYSPSITSKGAKAAKGIVAELGKQGIKTVGASYTTKYLSRFMATTARTATRAVP